MDNLELAGYSLCGYDSLPPETRSRNLTKIYDEIFRSPPGTAKHPCRVYPATLSLTLRRTRGRAAGCRRAVPAESKTSASGQSHSHPPVSYRRYPDTIRKSSAARRRSRHIPHMIPIRHARACGPAANQPRAAPGGRGGPRRRGDRADSRGVVPARGRVRDPARRPIT